MKTVDRQGVKVEHLWSRPLVWCLLIPLVFFSLNGYVPFVESPYYVSLYATEHTTANGLKVLVECFIIYCIMAVASFPKAKTIMNTAGAMKYLSMLTAYAIVSTLWSNEPLHTLTQSTILVFPMLFAFYLAREYSFDNQISILQGVCLICVAASFVFVTAFPLWGLQHGEDYEGTWRGIFHHKNECAANLTILFTAIINRRRSGLLSSCYKIVGTSLVLLFIYKSQSRAGWLLVATYLTIHAGLTLLVKFKRSDLPIVATLLIFVASFVILSVLMNYQSIAYFLGKDPTFTGRTMIWEATITSLRQRIWLGSGYDAFWKSTKSGASYIFAMAKWSVTNAHNGVLDILLQLGIPGVTLFLLSLIKAIKDGLYTLLNGDGRTWYIEIVLVVVGTSLTESTLIHGDAIVWFLYIFACTSLHFTAELIKTKTTELKQEGFLLTSPITLATAQRPTKRFVAI